jgi:16S rRNA (guanine966-N2)-methyltransferase
VEFNWTNQNKESLLVRIVSGKFGGRQIKTTSGQGYRPATDKVRQAIFSMLESRGVVWPQIRVLDCFAGSGSLGLEALSREAAEVWFIENSKRAADLIRSNLQQLGVSKSKYRIWVKDVFRFLRQQDHEPFNLVFTDPPYGKDFLLPSLELLLEQKWVEQDALILAEVESDVFIEEELFRQLTMLQNRKYGQTRIYIWKVQKNR